MATINSTTGSAQSAKVINMESNNGNYCQSFVTPWGTDPERYWERPDYVKAIANTIMSQIFAGLKAEFGDKWQSVLASWGCVPMPGAVIGKLLRWREMPAFALHVNGYQHKGWIVISLNEGADTYELELTNEQMYAKEGSRTEDVYCEELGSRIDAMVETGDDLAAYDEQVGADPDNAEILELRKRFPNLQQVVVL